MIMFMLTAKARDVKARDHCHITGKYRGSYIDIVLLRLK